MEGKFVVAQREVLSLLASMQPICNKRTTLDVTESILFQVTPKELTLKATDLEISLQSNITVESDFTENMSFLISGKRIFEVVKEMDGDIEFTLDEAQVRLKSGGVDLALNIKESKEFPPFPERIENMMEIEGAFLLTLLNKVSFVIPQNNANQAMNGLLLEFDPAGMSMVSTDGHCLAHIKTEKYTHFEEKKWLLPKRAVLEIKKILENNSSDSIFLGTCGNQLVFSGKNFNFFTKLINDPFPQYKSVLDKDGFMPARLSKEPFLKTLKRTSSLLAGQFVSTNFTFSPGLMNVKLHNKEVGKLEESLLLNEYSGNAVESRFYSPYLLNGLQVFSEDVINFHIKNGAKPIIFEATEKDWQLTYLVMPVSMTQAEK
jgi:DNA polymerase-3 subunit beta